MNFREMSAGFFERETLDRALALLLERRGSDLHLVPESPPVFRIDGKLVTLPEFDRPMHPDPLSEVLSSILTDRARRILQEEKQVDFRYENEYGRFRVNVFREIKGLAATFRAIPVKIPTPEELLLPQEIVNFAEAPSGLVLVVGATGSGKSTTLASLINHINRSRACRIITIEDPVEFIHRSEKALISHRELGEHVESFAMGLRAALREDPDVILVGEMRDLETMALAIEAALTGHLVFATVHARSVTQTVSRIVKVFPPQEQERIQVTLADCLQGVVYQELVPRAGGGRVAIFEILRMTPASAEIIRKGAFKQISSIQPSMGYFSLEASLKERFHKGLIEEKVFKQLVQSRSDHLKP